MIRYFTLLILSLLLQSLGTAQNSFENEYYKIDFFMAQRLGGQLIKSPLPENLDISKNYLLKANSDNTYYLQHQRCNLKPESLFYGYHLILKKILLIIVSMAIAPM